MMRESKKRSFEESSAKNKDTVENIKSLNHDFIPGPKDVICGRGKAAREHSGNVMFRDMIEKYLDKYSKATLKHQKSLIVSLIIDNIRRSSPNGGFVRQAGNRWYEVGDDVIREKVGQSLRDSLHSKYRSSTKAKQRRRREEQIKLTDEVELILQGNCRELSEKFNSDSIFSGDDAKIQTMFNQANCQLLHVFKETEERARKKRRSSIVESPAQPQPSQSYNHDYNINLSLNISEDVIEFIARFCGKFSF